MKDYKKEIVEMLEVLEDERVLKQLYTILILTRHRQKRGN